MNANNSTAHAHESQRWGARSANHVPFNGQDYETEKISPLKSISLGDLLKKEIKPREMFLDPILPGKGLAMIFGQRGRGKSHIAMGAAVALAAGVSFLRWTAPKPRRVLLIDGELPDCVLQEWLATTVLALGADNDMVKENLRILAADMQEEGIPDLATLAGQAFIEPDVEWADAIFLDNLSALVRIGKENEGESWTPLQSWSLQVRRQGKSACFIHHAGRNDNPRGHSKREDLLDTIVALLFPPGYRSSEGLHTEIHYTKCRGFKGRQADPIDVQLTEDTDGKPVWVVSDVESVKKQKAEELFKNGCDVKAVIEELRISRATAFRYQREWRRNKKTNGSLTESQQ